MVGEWGAAGTCKIIAVMAFMPFTLAHGSVNDSHAGLAAKGTRPPSLLDASLARAWGAIQRHDKILHGLAVDL